MPIIWCWFSVFAPIIMIIGEFILAIESVLKFKYWYRSWNPQHGGQGWSEMLAISQKMKNENSLPGGHKWQTCKNAWSRIKPKNIVVCQTGTTCGLSSPSIFLKILSSKFVCCVFCDIRDKNAVNQVFWSKTNVFSLPATDIHYLLIERIEDWGLRIEN